MIYNFNLRISWASTGIEYAEAYRADVFRRIGQEAKFIFTNMFSQDNIEHMTKNIGFLDTEVIWLYTFFTDCKIAPVSYTLEQLEKQFSHRKYKLIRTGKQAKYEFEGDKNYYKVFLTEENGDLVHRVEMVYAGKLIRKDYYTYCRIYSEYYAPLDGKAHLYQRRFFNEDGTTAYEEIIDDESVMYQFPDRMLYSKEELVGYMMSQLALTEKDIILVDRTMEIGQPIIQNAGSAKIGIVIHSNHFNEGNTYDDNIRWSRYYEYPFSQYKHISAYLTATDAQNRLLREQFQKYKGVTPNVVTIPVGCLEHLTYPEKPRRAHALVTASRLAPEKHVDWIISAVAEAQKIIPDLSLDIFGKGKEEGKLNELIEQLNCGEYVHLCGHQDLRNVYKNYEAYLSGSTNEGFGLTLLEAAGSGLPIIGFDVRYGNQNFIEDGKNGYLIPVSDEMDVKIRIQKLAECIVRLFTETDLDSFHDCSYRVAEGYLASEVDEKWKKLLQEMTSSC